MRTSNDIDTIWELAAQEPFLASTIAVLLGAMVAVLTYMTFRSIREAGRRQPPVVVVILILGVVALITLVVIAIRPSLGESLGLIVASAVGGLAGAVISAFDNDKTYQEGWQDASLSASDRGTREPDGEGGRPGGEQRPPDAAGDGPDEQGGEPRGGDPAAA